MATVTYRCPKCPLVLDDIDDLRDHVGLLHDLRLVRGLTDTDGSSHAHYITIPMTAAGRAELYRQLRRGDGGRPTNEALPNGNQSSQLPQLATQTPTITSAPQTPVVTRPSHHRHQRAHRDVSPGSSSRSSSTDRDLDATALVSTTVSSATNDTTVTLPHQLWRDSVLISADQRAYRKIFNLIFSTPLPYRASLLVTDVLEQQWSFTPFEILFLTAITAELGREMLLDAMCVWRMGRFDNNQHGNLALISSQDSSLYAQCSGFYDTHTLDTVYSSASTPETPGDRAYQSRILVNIRDWAQLMVTTGGTDSHFGTGIHTTNLTDILDVPLFLELVPILLTETAKRLSFCLVTTSAKAQGKDYSTVSRTRLYRHFYPC
jgi:hypothetical protein